EDRDRQPVGHGGQQARRADGEVRRKHRHDRVVLMRIAAVILALAASLAASDGTTDLHRAISTNAPLATVQSLIAAGADVNAANRYGVTPLSLAAADGNDRLIDLLLKAGAETNTADASLTEGRTLLMLAARTGNVASIRQLLAHGENANAAETRTGSTALMWAALENRADAVRALVAGGANVNARSRVPA